MNATLVLGPAASGTRQLTRHLLAAGCQGDGDEPQRWDTEPPQGETPIVWRRTLPHGPRTPDLMGMLLGLADAGYAVQAVVTVRDWTSLLRHQLAQGQVPSREVARAQSRRAYVTIFGALGIRRTPFTLCSYESLVMAPQAVLDGLCGELGLPRVPVAELEPWSDARGVGCAGC